MSVDSPKAHPALWVPTNYFAMGLPFVVIAQASVLMLKNLGVSDSQSAFWTSFILWPWTLKPLWSPVLEMFRTKKYFVVATQLMTGVLFALVAFSLQLPGFFAYVVALLGLVAFAGATHDIATDGLYMDVLSSKDQASYIGWQGAAYNMAKVVAGGALVYLAGILENRLGVARAWMVVFGAFSAMMIFASLYHSWVLPAGEKSRSVKSMEEGFLTLRTVLLDFFYKKHVWIYILFIFLYRFAEGFAIKILPLFLRAPVAEGGLGLETSEIGVIQGVLGAVAFILGSILAGYVISAKGLKKTLFTMCCCLNIPYLGYAALAFFQPESIYVVGLAAAIDYFGYGFGFVGLMLFMMQQVAPGKYKMAHYAFATGIMNLVYLLTGMASGFLSDSLGYRNYFIWVLIATIPSLLAAWFVPFANPDVEDPDSEKTES